MSNKDTFSSKIEKHNLADTELIIRNGFEKLIGHKPSRSELDNLSEHEIKKCYKAGSSTIHITNRKYHFVIVILIVLLVGLGTYSFILIQKANQAYEELLSEKNSKLAEVNSLKSENAVLKKDLNDLNNKINDLNGQLSKKPAFVYVPTQPQVYKPPARTTCNPDYLGGFSCTTY